MTNSSNSEMILHTPHESNGNGTLSLARQYVQAGLSVIPIRRDGSKAPALSEWGPYEADLPTDRDLAEWFGRRPAPGIATVCGAVSGGLELLDFDKDSDTIYPQWCQLVEQEEPGLLCRLSVVKSPCGYHLRYRVPDLDPFPGNEKLAREPYTTPEGKPASRVLIETRGEGGYALAPGCPPECHHEGRLYEHVGGPGLTDLPALSLVERDVLIRCARAFNRVAEEYRVPASSSPRGGGLRPGEDYDRRGPDWGDILQPHGWASVGGRGDVQHWRRPDKTERGLSATTGFCKGKDGTDRLYVFSTNASPFEDGRIYSKFAVHALLNHQGDFKAAAKDLAEKGYGEQKKTKGKAVAGKVPAAEGAAAEPGGPDGYAIILGFFRTKYQPIFRRGTVLYSSALGREVKPGEACYGAPIELLNALATASDAPQVRTGGVDTAALPKFFNTWVRSAWMDLLDGLPEEEGAVEVSDMAQEEFWAKVSAGLHTIVAMGHHQHDQRGGTTEVQRRSLLDWCNLWAKPGRWQQVRSYQLWIRREPHPGGGERLAIALRVEVFRQAGQSDLSKLTQNKFGRLAALYGVAVDKPNTKVNGYRASILTQQFIDDLLYRPRDQDDSVGDSPFARVQA